MQDLNETKTNVTKQTLDFDGPPIQYVVGEYFIWMVWMGKDFLRKYF